VKHGIVASTSQKSTNQGENAAKKRGETFPALPSSNLHVAEGGHLTAGFRGTVRGERGGGDLEETQSATDVQDRHGTTKANSTN